MYRLGVDVGGTNTDAVLIDDDLKVIASCKTPTTSDIYTGILSAIDTVLSNSQIDTKKIKQAMLGTTQCTNAIVERKNLADIGILRIGAPASNAIEPMLDWPEDLKSIAKEVSTISGGFEYDGKLLNSFDRQAAIDFFERCKAQGIKSVAISCVFSSVRDDHEVEAAELASEILGENAHISLSSKIGSMGLIERENATILNASLYKVSASFTTGFADSLAEFGIDNAEIYFSQNDGTLMNASLARKYPILTIACGPTNSIRGASYLSNLNNAIVVDVGGTTADIGVLQNGFPRESGVAVTVGGIRTNFRMPDVISFGLGGGSIVREKNGVVTVGPDSVGYQISEKALVFGGDTITATDIAVRLGLADIGDKSRVAHIDEKFARDAMECMVQKVEDGIDSMKVNNNDIDVVIVGGGSVILPRNIKGATNIFKPENFSVANAIGSAISKVSGSCEKIVSYDEIPREEAIEKAKSEAIELAVASGAIRESVEIIDVEDIPLQYHSNNTCRVKVKAAGNLG